MATYWYTNDATSTSTAVIWSEWAQEATTSASTTTWACWSSDSCTTSAPTRLNRQPTPEYQRLCEEDIERRKKKMQEEQQAAKAAESLLRSCLDPEQLQEYDKDQQFHVVSSDGNRYAIDAKRRQHNIHRVDEKGQRLEELCVYQTGNTPLADNALAQKLALETDEATLRQTANIRRIAIPA